MITRSRDRAVTVAAQYAIVSEPRQLWSGLATFSRLLTVAALMAALAGCGGAPPSLVVAVNAGVEGDALKAAAREYGSVHSLDVEIVDLPYANLFEKELLDLSSHTGAYDVIMVDDPWFPRLSQNSALAPLGPEPPDPDFLKSCLEVCQQAGAYYALPYVGNSGLFFYRKDLFGKYGFFAPDTWSSLLAAVKKIATGWQMDRSVMA